MKLIFYLVIVVLVYTLPISANFLVSINDKTDYTLNIYQNLEDNNKIENSWIIQGTLGALVVNEGNGFAVKPASFDIIPNCCHEQYDGIEVVFINGNQEIVTTSGIRGLDRDFFITDDWNTFLSNHPDTDEGDLPLKQFNGENEIGYFQRGIFETSGPTFTGGWEYILDMRYSKIDGVLNYEYHLDIDYIKYDDGSVRYNRYIELEITRNGYDKENRELEPTNTFRINGHSGFNIVYVMIISVTSFKTRNSIKL